jgi:hypothetical protein
MKAFVISLSMIPASAETSVRVLEKLRSYDLDAVLSEGVYGVDAPDIIEKENRVVYPYGLKGYLIDERGKRLAGRLGVMGCFLSHYALWKHCQNLNESILIFEDDVIFTQGWWPVEWKHVLLIATGKSVYQQPWYARKLLPHDGQPQTIAFPGHTMPGAVGYGLTPQGAEILVNHYKNYYLPADNALSSRVVNLECHTHLMGRAAVGEADQKKSLTKTQMWARMREEIANRPLDDQS